MKNILGFMAFLLMCRATGTIVGTAKVTAVEKMMGRRPDDSRAEVGTLQCEREREEERKLKLKRGNFGIS